MKKKVEKDTLKTIKASLSILKVIGSKPKLTPEQFMNLKKVKKNIIGVSSGTSTLGDLLESLNELNKELKKTFKI